MIIYSENFDKELGRRVAELKPDRVFLFTDSNVSEALSNRMPGDGAWQAIVMDAGEQHKNVQTLAEVWQQLIDGGATRRSLLVNFGGGVVSDIGGFAAATFKRGIRFINVPTSLLAMVDASSGGKTGIDFGGLKNSVGVFADPECTIIDTSLLSTLPEREMRSGAAEIMKMALITSRTDTMRILAGDLLDDPRLLDSMIRMSVSEKERITTIDPHEAGLRKTLNFGHTAGHAIESLLLDAGRPVTHGEAVARGMLVALILSHMLLGMDSQIIYTYKEEFLNRYYGPSPVKCRDIDEIVRLTGHDKKNERAGEALFTLLEEPGKPRINVSVAAADIASALEISLQ